MMIKENEHNSYYVRFLVCGVRKRWIIPLCRSPSCVAQTYILKYPKNLRII